MIPENCGFRRRYKAILNRVRIIPDTCPFRIRYKAFLNRAKMIPEQSNVRIRSKVVLCFYRAKMIPKRIPPDKAYW